MEQEVVQSCLKGSFPFPCTEPKKKSGKTTGNRNRRIPIRVGVEKRAEDKQKRLSVASSVGMGLSSFITCLYSTCHGGDQSAGAIKYAVYIPHCQFIGDVVLLQCPSTALALQIEKFFFFSIDSVQTEKDKKNRARKGKRKTYKDLKWSG